MTGKGEKVIEEASKIAEEMQKDMYALMQREIIRFTTPLNKKISELNQKLTKYKRAFEILKDNAQISIKKCLWDGETIYYLVINQEYGDQIQFRLSKEEKELLEELMNCGTKDN